MTDITAAMKTAIRKTDGVSLHRTSFRLTFRYRGIKCRETLKLEVNKANLRYAADKIARIRQEIATDSFDYAKHFPDSPRAAVFNSAVPSQARTVSARMALYLKIKQTELSKSGYKSLAQKAGYFVRDFGDRRIDTINKSEIDLWRVSLLNGGLKPVTVNDIMTPVRQIMENALDDDLIDRSPTSRIRNYSTTADSNKADPFTREEIALLEITPTRREGEKAMCLFNVWVGLSISELIALAWEDIDFNQGTALICRSRVLGEWKVPKEVYRHRTVELIPPALRWLEEQKARTFHLPPVTIQVRQRNNRDMRAESIRPVWLNTNTGTVMNSDQNVRDRFLGAFLQSAGIRPRGANQLRHTFASQMLTHYVDHRWIINQLGHRDNTMLFRHYGKMIPVDIPRMADDVMRRLGIQDDSKLTPKPALRSVE